ncbi:phosphomethylpyrimidine kinase [Nitritalea halalkaliphila LW7]|uniref:hydroxymethylpyrimidine kinase n=1 Tax=Nitritalea halalkaliphila LW7 TaxID=1189621 RepID=I5CAI1_9BACT|nr:bifunctional hydroxymethylpyrimidine kinase/phosphomethylpyrimidine kinase [Nitritalea halalkaliphila]EIM78833.1 phosphomethylpyrimidine kinase [Nitritalea halalkaliphila LW7]
MTVLTALTAQNTTGVRAIHPVPTQFIQEQLDAIMEDIPPRAIKIGMINSPEVAHLLAVFLDKYPTIPAVFDPVMIATSGAKLIQDTTVSLLKETLFPRVDLITPNLDEAAFLINKNLNSLADLRFAGETLLNDGAKAVLVKGGHMEGETLYDYLVDRTDRSETFPGKRIDTPNMHGTGCSLSSAIAAYLGRGEGLFEAVANAHRYIKGALDAGKDVSIGAGPGPLNHFFQPEPLKKTTFLEVKP